MLTGLPIDSTFVNWPSNASYIELATDLVSLWHPAHEDVRG